MTNDECRKPNAECRRAKCLLWSDSDTLRAMTASLRIISRVMFVALLAAVTAAGATRTPLSAEAERAARTVTADDLSVHVGVLAADDMEGRGLETAGNERAAEYVANAFRQRAVPTALASGYFQDFSLFDATLSRATKLDVRNDNGRELLKRSAGEEFYPSPISAARTITARATFRSADAAGQIVIVPQPAGAGRMSELSRSVEEWTLKGAVGVIVVSPSLEPLGDIWHTGIPDDDPSYQSAEIAAIPVVHISKTLADKLRPLLRRGWVTIAAEIDRRPVKTRNVVAALPGADPARRDELVVVGAHLDHDGVDPQGGVFNGADDDASGVAGVLEVAEAFASAAGAGARPARTVIFAIWNAEEKGLFGSRHYVAHPAPRGRLIANLNLDMVGRDEDIPDPSSPRFSGFTETKAKDNVNVLHLLGYSHSPDLTSMVHDANESTRFDLRTTYDGGSHQLMRRSDHWSFIEQGIPALFLTTGLHPDYHTPDDDVGKINFEKLTRVTRMTFEAAWRVADAAAAPRFVP
jgi:Peptidase family M28